MLLDYHSLYGEQPATAPTLVWLPTRKKKKKEEEPERQRVTATVDATLPATQSASTATVRTRAQVVALMPVAAATAHGDTAIGPAALQHGRAVQDAAMDDADVIATALALLMQLDDDD